MTANVKSTCRIHLITVFAVTVQQMWGQGDLHVIDFIGLFANYEDAQQAGEAADYVTFDES